MPTRRAFPLRFAVCLAAALVGARAVAGGEPSPDRVLARYDGGTVTAAEYESWLLRERLEDDPATRADALRSIAVWESLAEAAGRRSAEETAEIEIQALALRMDALELAFRRDLTAKTVPDAAAVERAVAAARERPGRPRRVRLSNLFVRVPPGTSESERAALRAEAQRLRRSLVEGVELADLATQSDSQSRWQGGLIGWVKPGDLSPAVEEVAFGLAEGEVSPVLAVPDGFAILQAVEVSAAQPPAVDREQIGRLVHKERYDAAWREVEAEGWERARFDLEALRSPVTGSERLVARLAGPLELTQRNLTTLLRARGVPSSPAALSEERLDAELHRLATSAEASARARELGLDEISDVDAKLRWSRVASAATHELAALVKERFRPLSEPEIRAYSEAHAERFREPESYRLAVIRRSATRETVRPRYLEMEAAARRLAAGQTTFEEEAARLSELPSAAHGGDLGWLSRTAVAGLGPRVLHVVDELEAGEISPLVQQQESLDRASSLWIVRLLDHREARAMTYEEARDLAEASLGGERTQELTRSIQGEIAERLGVEILSP
ncbi:MAG: peptidylprolyl isomerase [Thermoanaerobaculia bacterium]